MKELPSQFSLNFLDLKSYGEKTFFPVSATFILQLKKDHSIGSRSTTYEKSYENKVIYYWEFKC